MADVTFSLGDFSATTATATATTAAGLELFASLFGAGAVSVELPKSKAADLAVFVERRGLVAR